MIQQSDVSIGITALLPRHASSGYEACSETRHAPGGRRGRFSWSSFRNRSWTGAASCIQERRWPITRSRPPGSRLRTRSQPGWFQPIEHSMRLVKVVPGPKRMVVYGGSCHSGRQRAGGEPRAAAADPGGRLACRLRYRQALRERALVRTGGQTDKICFCGALRSRTSFSSRKRSAGVTVMEIPVRMSQIRMQSSTDPTDSGAGSRGRP